MAAVKAIAAAAAVLALAATAAANVHATGERSAVLRLAGAHPVSLRGSKFLAGERVTVVVHSLGRTRSRKITASEGGTFLVRFHNLPFDRCHGFRAVAQGARGSVARYKLPELLERLCKPRG